MTHETDEQPMNDYEALEQAVACWHQAYQLQMQQRFDEAIRLYQESIARYPTAEAHTFLGWTYSMMGRLEEAIAECHQAIQVDPQFGNPYNDIGAYLIELNRLDEAIPWLKKAMVAERYECYHYPHSNLARILEKKGKWQEAISEYQQAMAHAPDDHYTKHVEHTISRLIARMN